LDWGWKFGYPETLRAKKKETPGGKKGGKKSELSYPDARG